MYKGYLPQLCKGVWRSHRWVSLFFWSPSSVKKHRAQSMDRNCQRPWVTAPLWCPTTACITTVLTRLYGIATGLERYFEDLSSWKVLWICKYFQVLFACLAGSCSHLFWLMERDCSCLVWTCWVGEGENILARERVRWCSSIYLISSLMEVLECINSHPLQHSRNISIVTSKGVLASVVLCHVCEKIARRADSGPSVRFMRSMRQFWLLAST